MPAITATAPGKIILFGEHAVVYGRPAIAVPVLQVEARAVIKPEPRGALGSVRIQAPDIGMDASLADLPESQPLAVAIREVFKALNISRLPAMLIRVTSSIPIAGGLGSGAAVSVAIIRALAAFLGHPLPAERVSILAYEVEKLHHGTPSGIDNTVITYRMPVFFKRGQPIQTFHIPQPFTIVIGDTGIHSPTSIAVGDLRRAWQANPDRYDPLFDAVEQIVQTAKDAVESGQPERLGPLMDQNHELLCQMDVSSTELNSLVEVARLSGALGAKLSGGGRGGNMIALAAPGSASSIAQGLLAAGAKRVIVTEIKEPGSYD